MLAVSDKCYATTKTCCLSTVQTVFLQKDAFFCKMLNKISLLFVVNILFSCEDIQRKGVLWASDPRKGNQLKADGLDRFFAELVDVVAGYNNAAYVEFITHGNRQYGGLERE